MVQKWGSRAATTTKKHSKEERRKRNAGKLHVEQRGSGSTLSEIFRQLWKASQQLEQDGGKKRFLQHRQTNIGFHEKKGNTKIREKRLRKLQSFVCRSSMGAFLSTSHSCLEKCGKHSRQQHNRRKKPPFVSHILCRLYAPVAKRRKKTPYHPRSKRHSSLISLSAVRLIHSCARPLFSLQQRVENNNPIKRYHRCRGLSAPFLLSLQELQENLHSEAEAIKISLLNSYTLR